MSHHNNHARSKQRRKALRMRNREQSVIEKRNAKRLRDLEPKGVTISGDAKDYANRIPLYTTNKKGKIVRTRFWTILDYGHARRLNQRQKRKRIRQGAFCR